MGKIVKLHDTHQQVRLLLPWRANGTLEGGERGAVNAHLAECVECRAELAAEQALRAHIAAMPSASRPEQVPKAEHVRPSAPVSLIRRRLSTGWQLAASAAVAATVALVAPLAFTPSQPRDDYRLLSSGSASSSGNAIVLFAPETPQRDQQAALGQVAAEIVGSPTAGGAFKVRLDPANRTAALDALRANQQVLLAEPIDPADGL
jgi:Putative zinc-finger